MSESEQYKGVCKGEFAKINSKLDRLYIDNGGESFQSKLNRHDLFIKKMTRIVYAIAIPMIALSLDAVRDILVVMFSRTQ
jgi:hypothetical protein